MVYRSMSCEKGDDFVVRERVSNTFNSRRRAE